MITHSDALLAFDLGDLTKSQQFCADIFQQGTEFTCDRQAARGWISSTLKRMFQPQSSRIPTPSTFRAHNLSLLERVQQEKSHKLCISHIYIPTCSKPAKNGSLECAPYRAVNLAGIVFARNARLKPPYFQLTERSFFVLPTELTFCPEIKPVHCRVHWGMKLR